MDISSRDAGEKRLPYRLLDYVACLRHVPLQMRSPVSRQGRGYGRKFGLLNSLAFS